eukprot:304062-Chlamydomonas_euryale.AAC.25
MQHGEQAFRPAPACQRDNDLEKEFFFARLHTFHTGIPFAGPLVATLTLTQRMTGVKSMHMQKILQNSMSGQGNDALQWVVEQRSPLIHPTARWAAPTAGCRPSHQLLELGWTPMLWTHSAGCPQPRP